jgi:hypothetical protein
MGNGHRVWAYVRFAVKSARIVAVFWSVLLGVTLATDRELDDVICQGMQDYVNANPGMSHATGYHLLMRKRPELFTDRG